MHYKCHKINCKRGGSYIDFPDYIKKKKATVNPNNDHDRCFQYATTTTLNFEQIKKDPKRVSNIIPFISIYNWEGINYPSKIRDWKSFEKNNPTIALNFLYILEKETCLAFIPKIYFKLWKTNNSLNDSKCWKRRLALSCSKKLFALLE